jgi:chorismate-pyruvate lyase
MPATPLDPAKELRLLLAFFGEGAAPDAEGMAPTALPEPERALLVHHGHMTETLERRHGGPVRVVPYRTRREGEIYGRKLDLLCGDGTVAMTGVMLVNLALCEVAVRGEILSEAKPLGRILVEHGVMRRVEAQSFLRVSAADPLVRRFGVSAPAYGRFATIFCDGRPAIDVLEIVRPEAPA